MPWRMRMGPRLGAAREPMMGGDARRRDTQCGAASAEAGGWGRDVDRARGRRGHGGLSLSPCSGGIGEGRDVPRRCCSPARGQAQVRYVDVL